MQGSCSVERSERCGTGRAWINCAENCSRRARFELTTARVSANHSLRFFFFLTARSCLVYAACSLAKRWPFSTCLPSPEYIINCSHSARTHRRMEIVLSAYGDVIILLWWVFIFFFFFTIFFLLAKKESFRKRPPRHIIYSIHTARAPRRRRTYTILWLIIVLYAPRVIGRLYWAGGSSATVLRLGMKWENGTRVMVRAAGRVEE